MNVGLFDSSTYSLSHSITPTSAEGDMAPRNIHVTNGKNAGIEKCGKSRSELWRRGG